MGLPCQPGSNLTRCQEYFPGAFRAIAGPDMVVLRTPAGFRGEDYATVADVTVTAGESVGAAQANHSLPGLPIAVSAGPRRISAPTSSSS